MKTLALGLLVTLGAFAQKIEIESDQTVDFSKFKTFAIRDGRLNSKNPSLNNELVRKRAGCGGCGCTNQTRCGSRAMGSG